MRARGLYLPGFERVVAHEQENPRIRPGFPAAEEHRDVLYTPAGRGETEIYRGGLFDSGGRRIEAGDLRRGRGAQLMTHNEGEPEPAQGRIGGRGIYLGWLFPHFGHAFLESLSRCWRAREADFDFAVFHATEGHVPAFMHDHLDRLGIPPVIFPTRPTRFDCLVVPEPAFVLKWHAYAGHLETFPPGRGDETRPVYVSRSRLPANRRGVVGEDVLERQLSGHRVIHPETLAVREQIEVFTSHRSFAGPLGSAMHAILFARSPEVVYLTGEDESGPRDNALLCDALVDADSLYVNCYDLGGLPRIDRSTPLRLDLARAGEALGVSINPKAQATVDRRHRVVWAQYRLRCGIRDNDPVALDDVKDHYSGPATEQLTKLERILLRRLGEAGTPAPAPMFAQHSRRGRLRLPARLRSRLG